MNIAAYATPDAAEQAFYDAFEAADLDAMMEVWANSEFVECIHPMTGRAQGRDSIMASWREIFSSGLRVRIQRSDIRRTQDALLAVHVLHEHLSIPGRDEHVPPIIATNIYQLIDGSWHLVLHHASPSARAGVSQPQKSPEIDPDKHQLH